MMIGFVFFIDLTIKVDYLVIPDILILPTDYYPSFAQALSDNYSREVVRDVIYHSHNLLPVFLSGKYMI